MSKTGTNASAVMMAVELRLATLEESEFILGVKNDPFTVAMSKHRAVITRKHHKAWLKRALEDWCTYLYIAYCGAYPVGTGRLDLRLHKPTKLSYAIAANCRRQGFGTLLVQALMDTARALGSTAIEAEVRANNVPSLKILLRAGFQCRSDRLLSMEYRP